MAFVILCDRCGKIIKPGNSSYTSVSCTMNGKMDVNEKLVELLDNAIIDSDDNYGFPNTNQVADRLIANGVTVVVRCKDCAVPHNKYTGCPMLNGLVTPPDFYCPFGERKDGDGNGICNTL